MHLGSPSLSLVALTILVALAPGIGIDLIYWSESGFPNKVRRGRIDGSDVEDVMCDMDWLPTGVVVDSTLGKVYWTLTSNGAAKIQWANLDGSNLQNISISGLPSSLALDAQNNKLYWTDAINVQLKRVNLDGTNQVETVVGLGFDAPQGLAVDPVVGKVYWSDILAGIIQCANFDGSDVRNLGISLSRPTGLAVDSVGRKLYWAESGTSRIQRSNLDGSNIENVVSTGNASKPGGVALDLDAGKIYWADSFAGSINRVNLDGSGDSEEVISRSDMTGSPWALSTCTLPTTITFSSTTNTGETFTMTTATETITPTTATISDTLVNSTTSINPNSSLATIGTTTYTTTTTIKIAISNISTTTSTTISIITTTGGIIMTPGVSMGIGEFYEENGGSNTLAMSILFPLLALVLLCAAACALHYGCHWCWDPKWSPWSVAPNPYRVDVKPCSQVSEAWQPEDCKENEQSISEIVPETPVKLLSESQVNVAITEGLRVREFDEVDFAVEPETPSKTKMIPGSQVIVTLPPAHSGLGPRGATVWEVEGDQARLFCRPPQR